MRLVIILKILVIFILLEHVKILLILKYGILQKNIVGISRLAGLYA